VAIFIASVIGAICAFDAKKMVFFRKAFELSRCDKRNKNFFQFSGFSLQLSAVLIEMSRQFSRRRHGDG